MQDLIKQLLLTPGNLDYSYQDCVLRYKGRRVIGTEGGIRRKIITALHDTQLGGHSGVQTIYHRAKQLFYWLGMYKDIKDIVLQCDTCRKCKDEHLGSSTTSYFSVLMESCNDGFHRRLTSIKKEGHHYGGSRQIHQDSTLHQLVPSF